MSGPQRLASINRRVKGGYEKMRNCSSSNNQVEKCVEERIVRLFGKTDVNPAMCTKSGWNLKDGLYHIVSADQKKHDGVDKIDMNRSSSNNTKDSAAVASKLLTVIELHGIPGFYLKENDPNKKKLCRHDATQDIKDPKTCFQSLVRIIAGQFVSGHAAQAAWKRILNAVDDELTPCAILKLISTNEDGSSISTSSINNSSVTSEMVEKLQELTRITRAKSASIIDLAQRFQNGQLSEEMLLSSKNVENDNMSLQNIRTELLKVKGIGPWSCDMFMMFYLEQSNILPLGDLGVRKGLALFFGWKGSAPKQQLCPKKDLKWIEEELQMYEPYRSLLTYFMWRVADTPIQDGGGNSKVKQECGDGPELKMPERQHKTKKRLKKEQPAFSSPSKKQIISMDHSSTETLVTPCTNERGEENGTPPKRRRSKRNIRRLVTP